MPHALIALRGVGESEVSPWSMVRESEISRPWVRRDAEVPRQVSKGHEGSLPCPPKPVGVGGIVVQRRNAAIGRDRLNAVSRPNSRG